MTFKKGEITNPRGRPRKGRALTEILERVGGEEVELAYATEDGGTAISKVIPNEVIARMVWQGLITRELMFPGDTEAVKICVAEWMELLKFVYKHVDGTADRNVDVSGEIKHTFSVEEWQEKRNARLKAVSDLPNIDNSFNAENVVDVRAMDVDDDEIPDKYKDVEFGLADDEDDDDDDYN